MAPSYTFTPLSVKDKISSVLDKTPADSDSIRFNLFPQDAMTEDDAVFLGDRIKDLKVSSLEISGNTLNGIGLETVAPYFTEIKNLTTLDLSGNDCPGAGVPALAKVLPKTKVDTLNLSGNTLYSSAGSSLGAALPATLIQKRIGRRRS